MHGSFLSLNQQPRLRLKRAILSAKRSVLPSRNKKGAGVRRYRYFTQARVAVPGRLCGCRNTWWADRSALCTPRFCQSDTIISEVPLANPHDIQHCQNRNGRSRLSLQRLALEKAAVALVFLKLGICYRPWFTYLLSKNDSCEQSVHHETPGTC